MSESPPDIETSKKTARKNMKAIARGLPKRLARLEANSVSRVRHEKGDILERLGQFYRSVDEVLAFVMRHTPCRRGCSGCCHYRIELFGIEAAYVELSIGIRRQPPTLPIAATHGLPCPFLMNNECTIYRHRPYVCRKFLTLDASSYWCQPERANATELPLIRFTKFDEAMALLVQESGGGRGEDIRNVFPYGLRREIA